MKRLLVLSLAFGPTGALADMCQGDELCFSKEQAMDCLLGQKDSGREMFQAVVTCNRPLRKVMQAGSEKLPVRTSAEIEQDIDDLISAVYPEQARSK